MYLIDKEYLFTYYPLVDPDALKTPDDYFSEIQMRDKEIQMLMTQMVAKDKQIEGLHNSILRQLSCPSSTPDEITSP